MQIVVKLRYGCVNYRPAQVGGDIQVEWVVEITDRTDE